jgi:ferrous iron transport protein A
MSETLDRAPAGTRVRVERIDGALATRLAELGLVPGSEIEVIRAIPLGGPVVLDRGGFRFAIRRTDASVITVSKGETDIPPKPDPASAGGGGE